MTKTLIYFLVDPRTSEIRYVGKTTQSLNARITAHMRDRSNCHKVHWLSQLSAAGLRPIGVVLSEVEGEWPWQGEECYWIAKLKSMGARLTNNTSGGDGVSGVTGESKERMLATWRGRKHSPETIDKLKIARRKRTTSQETKDKMSKSQSGRIINWGDKIAQSIRKITPEMALIIKARLDAGEQVGALAEEFGIHRTSMSKIKAGTYFDRYRKQ
jgi:hypothetical protein